MKQQLINFYLDWTNNWLTAHTMADHYGITLDECLQLIAYGKKYHEENL